MKCGSMTCRIYDGTCDGGQILGRDRIARHEASSIHKAAIAAEADATAGGWWYREIILRSNIS